MMSSSSFHPDPRGCAWVQGGSQARPGNLSWEGSRAMLRPAFAAALLSVAPLLSADLGFGDWSPWSRLGRDDLPQDPEAGYTVLQPSHLLCPLHWLCPAFAQLQLTPESLELFHTYSQALWPFCGVLLASWLWHKVRRRWRCVSERGHRQGGAVPLGTGNCQGFGPKPLKPRNKNQKKPQQNAKGAPHLLRAFSDLPRRQRSVSGLEGETRTCCPAGIEPTSKKIRGPPQVFFTCPAACGRPVRLEFQEKMPRPFRRGSVPQGPCSFLCPPLLCYFQEKLRPALVSVGTDCQEFTCCSHEALHRLAASTALMRSYLRRLRRLHWQESGQRLHGRRPERSTKRQRKVEDEQEEERLMSACLYNPSYSGAAGVLCD